MGKFDFIDRELDDREEKALYRRLRSVAPLPGPMVEMAGLPHLVFCSNDYLGLSRHPLLRERAALFAEKFGAGAAASRLVCGNYTCFDVVEEKLAALKGTEAALVLNAGYQANFTLLQALTDRKSLILSDRLNHNSIIMGALLARCKVLRFQHNDMAHLERLLAENRSAGFSRTVIVTESVFSMDGDQSDIDTLADLARRFDAILMVDEAHATGVLGPGGMGLTCGKSVDLTMGTFGKAGGSYGAYIACSRKMREYMINRCNGFIYTTGLPPAVVGAIDAALDLMPGMDAERAHIHRLADRLRAALADMGLSTGTSSTQIVPAIVGTEADTLALSRHLEAGGILATAIRPPTVAKGESRIRLAVTALHTQAHVERLIGAFGAWEHGHAL